MVQARCTNDDRVAILALHQAVVRDPSESDLRESEVVLRRDGLNLIERFEVVLVPVPTAVILHDNHDHYLEGVSGDSALLYA